MECFRIEGGQRLCGQLGVHAAKNAVLPIMAAAILTGETVMLEGCPDITDVKHMGEILQILGCRVTFAGQRVTLETDGLHNWEMPDRLSKQIRSSIFLLGPILSRFKKATVTYPGGCEIGLRPIDLHLQGLRALGAQICEEGGMIFCDGRQMRAGDVHFDYPSVGATENVMMAAAMLKGHSTIHNAAREPEIEDLQKFMNACGARVTGAGSHTVVVEGVQKLKGITYRPMADRIVAGTLLAGAAVTGGEIILDDAPCKEMVAITSKLKEMGCRVFDEEDRVALKAPERLRAFSQLQTQPHPGFPTDMQVQMLALASVAKGTSVVVENVFENRFTHAGDLNRMGANILVNGRTAIVQGVESLKGRRVTARDLRGGAALVLAGLRAEGVTWMDHASLVDRGYDHLEHMLSALGGRVNRCPQMPS